MKRKFIAFTLAASALIGLNAANLVLLHTNDTHSHLEPEGNIGGILQRKALIDSIRQAEKNVILIDAGDMVQGSLYFKLWGGDVEYPLFNMMGYDIRILGNHEFDNGMEALARHYKKMKATPLSANYDFTGTELDGVFQPYVIKKVDGKKIGFIGLNVYPYNVISDKNIKVDYKKILPTANELARRLKDKEKVDLVVAVTHIGYDSDEDDVNDVELAKGSKDIDIIIGGHSHTTVEPGSGMDIIENAEGRPVLVTQTGKYGKNLGYIKVDLDKLDRKKNSGKDFEYRLLPVTNRFPESAMDAEMKAYIDHYRQKVDSVNRRAVGVSAIDMKNHDVPFANFTADMAQWYGDLVLDSIGGINGHKTLDAAIMNIGGIRRDMQKGMVSEGNILDTYPFTNFFVILDLKGSDLIETLKISAKKPAKEAISNNLRVLMRGDSLSKVLLKGKEVNPEEHYLIGTINYLAAGKDFLIPLTKGKVVWNDKKEVCVPIMRYITEESEKGMPINPDRAPRFLEEVVIRDGEVL